jgi:hypothetical protein
MSADDRGQLRNVYPTRARHAVTRGRRDARGNTENEPQLPRTRSVASDSRALSDARRERGTRGAIARDADKGSASIGLLVIASEGHSGGLS